MSLSIVRSAVSQCRLFLVTVLGSAALLNAGFGWAAGAPPAPPPVAAAQYPADPNETSPPVASTAVSLPPADPGQVAQGKQLYKDYCLKCHGIDMASPGAPFFDLRTFPHGEQPRFVASVTNGKRAMPAWGTVIKPSDIEMLWAYVSSYNPQ